MSRKKPGHILVYGLMALLFAGLGGFGIRNFGGTATTVATVGDRDITAQQYFRALNQAVRAQQAAGAGDVSLAAMEAKGLPAQIRGQLVAEAALDNEASHMGISVGDEEVARRITALPAFAGPTGKFDKATYEDAIGRAGFKVPEFESNVREEAARQILQTSVAAGLAPPRGGLELIFAWLGERRGFSAIRFDTDSRLAAIGTPTDAELSAFFDETKAAYILPEMKRVTYAVLTPDMVLDSVDIDEAALRTLYADRMDQYAIPERRLVERLVFGTADEAAAAKAQLDAGNTDFAALVAGRGLTLQDVDEGAVSREDLGQAGDAVFGLTDPGVVGPYPSDLGPALYRMNGVLPAREISFEAAAPELRAELGEDAAKRKIADMASDFDDRLAGGATLEDLAAETPMQIATVDVWDGSTDPILEDAAFRSAAEALGDGDFPQIDQLDGGGVFALRLDEVLPPRQQDLGEVREEVVAAWRQTQAAAAAVADAEAAKAQLDAGTPIADLGAEVETSDGTTRMQLAEASETVMSDALFSLSEGESKVVGLPDGAVLVQLESIAEPDASDPRTAQLQAAIGNQITQGIASDAFLYYVQALVGQAGVSVNDAGVNSVHSQVFR
ncbi:peptidylprolyl isomerase [Tropicimonas sp. IMCC34043]|uniref:peptidylprolyl isomerase n=1 Tax=Tropicimonas sp. IMCC34043 TaxID=2248760 RepID=UPI000E239244|nr:peptidylprolyl isomerase [Tropicimonas sp. IMCC34043]